MTSLQLSAEQLELESPEISEEMRMTWTSVWDILSNYVQPSSTMSLDEAINRTAGFYEVGTSKPCPITRISIFLGTQIPYDHPAHTKLANYVLALGESLKWITKSRYSGKNTMRLYVQHMIDNMNDQSIDPTSQLEEGQDPMDYVNSQAFTANFMLSHLMSKHLFISVIPSLAYSMNAAFKQNHSEEPHQAQDAWVMGAAQWILWRAEEAFSLVQKPGDPAVEKAGAKFHFWQKKKKADAIAKIWPYTWDKWQDWKAAFRAIARNEAYGSTCRDLAERAADLMAIQEKGLANGYPASPLNGSKPSE